MQTELSAYMDIGAAIIREEEAEFIRNTGVKRWKKKK